MLEKLFVKLSALLSDVQLAAVELENGLTLTQESEEWVPGELAYVTDKDGNVSIAPEGAHKAVDGQTYHVDSEGKLVNWTTTPAEVIAIDEPKPMEEMGMYNKNKSKMAEIEIVEGPEYSEDVMARLDAMAVAIGEIMNRIASLESAHAEMVTPVVEEMKKMRTRMEELSAAPASVSLSAIDTAVESNLTPEEQRINRFSIMAKHLQNK